jgi:hypothetical protein
MTQHQHSTLHIIIQLRHLARLYLAHLLRRAPRVYVTAADVVLSVWCRRVVVIVIIIHRAPRTHVCACVLSLKPETHLIRLCDVRL